MGGESEGTGGCCGLTPPWEVSNFLSHPLARQIQVPVDLHNLKPVGASCGKKASLVFNVHYFPRFCIYQFKVLSSTK